MVDNLAEKVNKCPLNWGHWVLFAYNWDRENCPLYRVAGCPLFRDCLNIEVNGRTVGTFRIVLYIVGVHFSAVSVKRGSIIKKSCSHNFLCSILSMMQWYCQSFPWGELDCLEGKVSPSLILGFPAPLAFLALPSAESAQQCWTLTTFMTLHDNAWPCFWQVSNASCGGNTLFPVTL